MDLLIKDPDLSVKRNLSRNGNKGKLIRNKVNCKKQFDAMMTRSNMFYKENGNKIYKANVERNNIKSNEALLELNRFGRVLCTKVSKMILRFC